MSGLRREATVQGWDEAALAMLWTLAIPLF